MFSKQWFTAKWLVFNLGFIHSADLYEHKNACSKTTRNRPEFLQPDTTLNFTAFLLFTFKNSNSSNNFYRKTCEILGNYRVNNVLRGSMFKYSWFWPKRMKIEPKFVRDCNSSLKLLTFQLSNITELETIKYTSGTKLNNFLIKVKLISGSLYRYRTLIVLKPNGNLLAKKKFLLTVPR